MRHYRSKSSLRRWSTREMLYLIKGSQDICMFQRRERVTMNRNGVLFIRGLFFVVCVCKFHSLTTLSFMMRIWWDDVFAGAAWWASSTHAMTCSHVCTSVILLRNAVSRNFAFEMRWINKNSPTKEKNKKKEIHLHLVICASNPMRRGVEVP